MTNESHAATALPERQIEARSEVRRVHGILERMNPRGAVLLVMHDVLGHSVPEVAEMLGIQLSTAQSRLRRAREEFLRRNSTCRLPDAASVEAYSLLSQLKPAPQTH
jgi:RNA polymerase sigma factor (sigma-70 family)